MTSKLSGLYAITDHQLMPDKTSLLQQVETSLLGGVRIIQYRDKSNDTDRRLDEATALLGLCRRYQTPLLINDDIALAAKIGADGVHLGQSDGAVTQARDLLGPTAIIGVTCHDSLELAIEAQTAGADYVAFGAFFPSKTKPNAKPAPMNLLKAAKEKLHLPIVAIGGISMDNAEQIITEGADMVAVIHALYAQDDIQKTADLFASLFTN